MIMDSIFFGLSNIIGFEMVFLFFIFFSILVMGLSQNVGFVSMVVVYIMSVWFFFTYPINQIYIINYSLAVGLFIVFGYIIGILVFNAFYRY